MAIPHASYKNGGSFKEETYNNLSDAAHKPSYSYEAFRKIFTIANGSLKPEGHCWSWVCISANPTHLATVFICFNPTV